MTLRQAIRPLLITAALLMGAITPPAATPADKQGEAVSIKEVRIRKLHLVRPDLIPYPLYYEVVC